MQIPLKPSKKWNLNLKISLYNPFGLFQVQSPFILEHLQSDTIYEVYIDATNIHGTGDASQRMFVTTQSKVSMNECYPFC